MAWACGGQLLPCGPLGLDWATLCGQPHCYPGLRFIRGQPPASDVRGEFLYLLTTSGSRTLEDLLSVAPENSCRELAPGPAAPRRLSPSHCPHIASGEPCKLSCPYDTYLTSRFPKSVPKGLHPLLYLQGLYTQTNCFAPGLFLSWVLPSLPPCSIDPLNSSTLELGAGEWVACLLWASVAPEPSRLTGGSLAASMPPCLASRGGPVLSCPHPTHPREAQHVSVTPRGF